VRKKLTITSLLLAWLCANGAVLDLAQVVAWGKMFAGYATTMSVGTALRETFDAAKPCPLCASISAAKRVEQKQAPIPSERATVKLDLVCEAPPQLVFASPSEKWRAALPATAPMRFELVPVPPPRRA
jgi:hypothetical protein